MKFFNFEPALYSWNKFLLVVVYSSVLCCWIQLAHILSGTFVSLFILVCSCLVLSLSDLIVSIMNEMSQKVFLPLLFSRGDGVKLALLLL